MTVSRRSYISLFLSYGISFGIVGVSYIFYSRILSPAEFGLYSIALTIGSVGIFILDGGLKTAIIKDAAGLSPRIQSVMLSWLLGISVALSLLFLALRYPLTHFFPAMRGDYLFLTLFAIVYLLTYPFIVISTAFLERKLDYSRLSWVEATSIVMERGGAVPLLLWTNLGIYSFVLALLAGRLFRVLAVSVSHRVRLCCPRREELRGVMPLMTEGGWIQFATGFSLVRDNLHVLLIGPFYGKAWVGYYSWGLQLCMVLSQAFVQVSARISLPRMAQDADNESRWQICISQIRYLTILTAPVLAAALLVLPGVNASLFLGKWTPVFSLLPFLFLRMLAGMAITPVGTLVPVQCGANIFARATFIWTVLEIVGAMLLIALIGSKGLAVSYSFMAFLGLTVYIRVLGSDFTQRLREVFAAVFCRPSLYISLIMAGAILIADYVYGGLLATPSLLISCIAVCVIIVSYLTENLLRKYLYKLGHI